MKLRMLDVLVCPIDKTKLELLEWDSSEVNLSAEDITRAKGMGLDPALFAREVRTGVLLNRAKKLFYPIHEGVPRMLTFPSGVAREFTKQHAQRLARELQGFMLPHEKAMPGEEMTLRTYSSVWVNYDWDGQSYWNLEPEVMFKSMDFLLDLDRQSVKDKLVVEVGIGIGGIADHVARREGCELVGIDLSYAVDPAYKSFGSNPFLHIVQASAFAPPFGEKTIDFVYSQGVLLVSYSTKVAFDQISKLPKIGGRLYVWGYSHYNEQRTMRRRVIMLMENAIRPWCCRLPESLQAVVLTPLIPLYMIHQNFWAKHKEVGNVNYGWREAMHAARDRFTPRYLHRHTDEEMCGWFRDAGYTALQCVSKRERPYYVPLTLVTNTGVEGIRTTA